MNNTFIIFSILLVIILLEYTVKRNYLGIIILHNNDHTLNKILQTIMNFMNEHLIHYQILVIKEKSNKKDNPDKKHSTGYLFNIGMRQLPGYNQYLFIDTNDCDLKNYYKNLNSKKISIDKLFIKKEINYYDKICAISISKELFKNMDGFSNIPNKSFKEFIENFNKHRSTYGSYFSMNLNINYDIVERVPINSLCTRITIKY